MKIKSVLNYPVLILALVWPFACGSFLSEPSSNGAGPHASSYSPSKSKSQYVIKSYYRNDLHPLLYYNSTYETMTHLDENIELYYEGDKVPEEAVFIVHGEQIARNKNCVHATINALKRLQESAKKLGANAIVNLAPKWDGETLRVDDNYFCAGGTVTYGIIWEGDLVKIKKDEDLGGTAVSQGDDPGTESGGAQISPPPEEAKEEIAVSITMAGKIIYGDKAVSMDFILGILEEKLGRDSDLL